MRSSTANRSCAWMRRTHTSTQKKTRNTVGFINEWVKMYHATGGRVENPWWVLQRQLYGRRNATKKFNHFVVTATDGIGLEQMP